VIFTHIPSAVVEILMISGVLASELVDTSEDSKIANGEVVEAITNTSVVRGAENDDAVVKVLKFGLDWV
jgi:hypothetical protein